jgi:hypothetical protein
MIHKGFKPQNKTYIWKVRLNQPLPGEPSDYKGTILRL